ncbi:DUF4252 domain-containing protein [Sungkyunkwania multivorans]|uniref:DUF4252 domain-containing protein n=1 Tax=Sungkyunkwania multivorans TaxID=1173618 RepID=A0ABW3CXN1_9FLAO
MKKALFVCLLVIFTSCGSYLSMNSFYNRHKNDPNVSAVRVPVFMFSFLQGLSPEMNGLLNNVNDLRYMQLRDISLIESERINAEMSQIITDRFVEVYRKNDGLARTVYSVREKGDVIKEVIIYTNNGSRSTIVYLNGNFAPQTIRMMAKNDGFESLSSSLSRQYQPNGMSTPGITN